MKTVAHGGNVWEAERRTRHRFNEFLDFSSNVNPLGPPEGAREVFVKGFKKITCYPDPEYTRLRKSLSKFLGIDYGSIFAGNGLSHIIDLAVRAHNFREGIIVNPTYREYELALLKYKIPVTFFNLREKDNFNLDGRNFFKLLNSKSEAVIFLCNPNNPTGAFLKRRFFDALLRSLSFKKHWLIVDEAFIDFTPYGREGSLISFISAYPRLIVLWSLTKIFSMPGLRLGVAIANDKVIKKLQAFTEPWSVNIAAEEVAITSLKDKAFLRKTQFWIKKEREWLFNSFNKFKELKVYPSEANFFLARILNKSFTAEGLNHKLLRHNILIRDCSNFRSLDKYFFRAAVKDRKSNKKFISALRRYLE